jgi:hypothetical protein
MMQPSRNRQRPLIALITAALLVPAGGAVAARADDDRGRDRRGYDHRYGGDHGGYRHDHKHDHKHYGKHDRYRGDGYRDRYHYDRNYYRGYPDHGYGHRRFVAPRHLYYRDYPAYDRYYRGPVYYAPHRHQHRVYLFPVIVGGYTEYRPYAYCGDAWYPDHYRYDGGRGHLSLHFGF